MSNAVATAVDARAIAKRFGELSALRDVSVIAHAGEIHGLLGPNGAGKTTLLRILLGLVRRDAGDIWLFGRELPPRAERVPDGVAAVFEHPGFYPYLSGTRNLSLLARMDGRPAGDAARGRAIERVGLTTAADRRVDGYSAGMRQRLGLAAALLRGPRLLFLDEPTSALDPAGARDVRELVRELAAAGAAIVISSHDLVEVEELCTSVTILRAGELVFSGSLEHLRARAGDDAHHLATSDDDTALAIARDCRGIRAARTGGCTHGFDAVGERDAVDAYVVALGRAGIAVRVLQPRQRSLESVFLRLTSTGDHQ